MIATAIGPATSEKNFSFDNGTYHVGFVNDGIVNKGELMVDDENITWNFFLQRMFFWKGKRFIKSLRIRIGES